MMHLDLALVWAGLLAFAVLAYVILDGFDLGVGILFPFMPDERHRDEMMNSVAPVWDGNETWLVLGGGGLFVIGAQFGLNALAGSSYPTFIRSTGVGWALGIGRIGSILGPVVGGVLIALKLPTHCARSSRSPTSSSARSPTGWASSSRVTAPAAATWARS